MLRELEARPELGFLGGEPWFGGATPARGPLTLQRRETSPWSAMGRKLTIGALSRRTGVPVRTLRFWSDEGLLPPLARSESGYRLYGEEHVARIDLIHALRETGIGHDAIGKLLRHELSLDEVLRLRLVAVESHLAGLQRIAAALRAAIAAGPSPASLRRITMATRLSNEQRRRRVTELYERATAGLAIDRGWLEGQIDASLPPLPDSPSTEQLSAWAELDAMLEDPMLVACKRVNAADMWTPPVDPVHFVDAQVAALAATAEARVRGVSPSSAEAGAIVAALTASLARAAGDADVTRMRDHLRVKYEPRGARFWELVTLMRGEPGTEPPHRLDDWRWLGEAFRHHAS